MNIFVLGSFGFMVSMGMLVLSRNESSNTDDLFASGFPCLTLKLTLDDCDSLRAVSSSSSYCVVSISGANGILTSARGKEKRMLVVKKSGGKQNCR